MKTKNLFLFAGIAVTAIVVFQIVKQKKTRKRMAVVADEGYETAEDILFPKGRSLRLG